MRLSASLVLYKNKQAQFEVAISSFLDGYADGLLYVIDNSPQPLESALFADRRVRYVFNGKNIGFGSGHNLAIRQACLDSDVHLILNPDICFNRNVLPRLLALMHDDATLSALMPKVVYPDGSLQRLCKLLPTPLDLLIRRFLPFPNLRAKLNARYELHGLSQEHISEIPALSGCFLLVRSSALLSLGGFDERYFMYMEDVDLVRRLGDLGATVYVPNISVVHEYAKGSYRNKKLLGYHLTSAIRYFNKWGWLFDAVRSERNLACLKSLRCTFNATK